LKISIIYTISLITLVASSCSIVRPSYKREYILKAEEGHFSPNHEYFTIPVTLTNETADTLHYVSMWYENSSYSIESNMLERKPLDSFSGIADTEAELPPHGSIEIQFKARLKKEFIGPLIQYRMAFYLYDPDEYFKNRTFFSKNKTKPKVLWSNMITMKYDPLK
jgi:hypothetical protein